MLDFLSSAPRSSSSRTHNALAAKHSDQRRLEELIDQHIATLHAAAGAGHSSGTASAREEAESRQAILQYKPRSEREVNEKLTYIAAYILKTGKALTPQEMDLVLSAPGRA